MRLFGRSLSAIEVRPYPSSTGWALPPILRRLAHFQRPEEATYPYSVGLPQLTPGRLWKHDSHSAKAPRQKVIRVMESRSLGDLGARYISSAIINGAAR
jgi:hypothetical protein